MLRTLLVAGTLSLTALSLGGCSSTDSQHMQETTKQEGQKLEKSAKEESQKLASSAKVEGKKLEKSVTEGVNTTKIKAALTASSKLDASHITVETVNANVYLRGSVPTADEKQLAVHIASDTIGKDQHVVDELKVEAHPSDKDKSSPTSTATP